MILINLTCFAMPPSASTIPMQTMHARPGLQQQLVRISRTPSRQSLKQTPAMQEHSAGGVTPRAAPVIFSIADLTAALGLASHLVVCQGCISWQAVRDGITSISHGAALELRDRTTLKALAELILAEEPAQAALQGALGLPGCPPLGNSLQSFRYSICMPAGRLKVQRAALCSHGMALHAVFGQCQLGSSAACWTRLLVVSSMGYVPRCDL